MREGGDVPHPSVEGVQTPVQVLGLGRSLLTLERTVTDDAPGQSDAAPTGRFRHKGPGRTRVEVVVRVVVKGGLDGRTQRVRIGVVGQGKSWRDLGS